ncbi:ABC transporter permease [Xylanivirga thermophila]|jgi:putative aldouronate transport system permease protein|uniref:ABC transporter permease n=1 Tax=Xylanivirga thermophila TaxID=2496273 RepID=UPI00101C1AA5|nr:ABC transporter permease subunit [Xylanivirga thermophila]
MVSVKARENVKNKFSSKNIHKTLSQQKYLIAMSLPFVIWVIIFAYVPLWGWTMAFQEYKPGIPFSEQQWVGFKHFIKLFKDPMFYLVMRNTIVMSLLGLLFGFTLPIILALLLNEINNLRFKKTVQTVSYLPHFVSWVVVASIVTELLSMNGPLNNLLLNLGIKDKPVQFLIEPKSFWWIVTAADVWKELGWNSIIFLASISSINPELYEAATVDGAGRFAKMRHITLPGIMPTVVVILIMSIGNLINIGFEKQLLLGNPLVKEYADVLDIYILNYGIGSGRYSLGTAAGMFKSLISLILLTVANTVSKKTTDIRVI